MADLRTTDLLAWRKTYYHQLDGKDLAIAIKQKLGSAVEGQPVCTRLTPTEDEVAYRICVRGRVNLMRICECLKEYRFHYVEVEALTRGQASASSSSVHFDVNIHM